MRKSLLASAMLLGLASGAHALSVDFEPDRGGVPGLNNTQNAVVGLGAPFGNLTISADTFTVSGSTLTRDNRSTAVITQNDEGLGVCNNFYSFFGCVLEDPELDDSGRNDILFFSFASDILLESITFELVDDNDDFVLATQDGQGGLTFSTFKVPPASGVDDPAGNPNPDESTFTINPALLGSLFGIGVQPGGQGRRDVTNDQFRISKIEISAVPLPAALPLLVGGIAAFGFLKRRKEARA